MFGEVLAVGPGEINKSGKLCPLSIQKGETVLFSSYAGTSYVEGNVEYLILTEDDVLAVMGEEK